MAVELRCDIADCRTGVDIAPSGGYTKNFIVKSGTTIGITLRAVDAGEEVTIVYSAPKIAATVAAAPTAGYPVGTKFYHAAGNQTLTTTSSGNTLCAVVIEDAAAGATEVICDFYGLKT